jgi:quercetin dioxygenase-like cupin family protein
MADNSVLAQHSLTDEIERFRPGDNEAGRRAEILVKEDDLRVTLVTMRSGVELDEHAVPVSLSIQVLSGQFEVHYDQDTARLVAGDFIALRKNVRHTVRSLEDGAFLLTLGWPASGS